jgi:hypothetical protein
MILILEQDFEDTEDIDSFKSDMCNCYNNNNSGIYSNTLRTVSIKYISAVPPQYDIDIQVCFLKTAGDWLWWLTFFIQDKNGHSLLHLAVMLGYTDVCECLIENGFDTKLIDKDGYTGL